MDVKFLNKLVDENIVSYDTALEIENELLRIKDILVLSKAFPKSLSGACNLSSMLVQSVLENFNVDATLINNSKHAFNLIHDKILIDLTASQISNHKFSDKIVCMDIENASFLSKQTIRGQKFYNQIDDDFFIKGDLDSVFKVNLSKKNDMMSLYNLLYNFIHVLKLENQVIKKLLNEQIDTNIVNSISIELISEIKSKDFYKNLSNKFNKDKIIKRKKIIKT